MANDNTPLSQAIDLAIAYRNAVAHQNTPDASAIEPDLIAALESLGATSPRDAIDCGRFAAHAHDPGVHGMPKEVRLQVLSGAEDREPPGGQHRRPLMRAAQLSTTILSPPDGPPRLRAGDTFRWVDQPDPDPNGQPIITGSQFMPFAVGETRAGQHWYYRMPGDPSGRVRSVHDDEIEPVEQVSDGPSDTAA